MILRVSHLMDILPLKKIVKFYFSLVLLLPLFSLNINSEVIIDKSSLKELNKKIHKYTSSYLLGPGDLLEINFEGLEIFNNDFIINAEGEINVPELGKLYIEGLTLEEFEIELNNKYTEFILDPKITISIKRYRPVSIYISGESNLPGLHTLNYIGSDQIDDRDYISPKLFDAIKIAEGVTNYADLKNIKIIRVNSKSQGSGKISANINLLDLLLKGDQSQNIRLYDGDVIVIPRAQNQLRDQILKVTKTNINPLRIKVYVTGNVENPGEIEIDRGATLNQAIATSGGKKFLTGNIEFLRFNDDGSTLSNKFKFNNKATYNTKENPVLMDGDIINVRRTLLGATTEVLREISTPVLSGYGIYGIFSN